MKVLSFLLCIATVVYAQHDVHDMTVGDWRTEIKATSENHTHVTEIESLNLHSDHTFEIAIHIDLKKGEHFIKDLRVKANGIWKRHITTLVLVIQKRALPFAKEVSNTITPQSLQALAKTYQAKLNGSPIRIYTIILLTKNRFTIVDEKGIKTEYNRYIPVKQKPVMSQKTHVQETL